MTHDRQAWQCGYDAGIAGVPMTNCPYAARTLAAASWYCGFIEGHAKHHRQEYADIPGVSNAPDPRPDDRQ